MSTSTSRTRRPFSPTEAATLLSRTPALLSVWLRDLPPAWIASHEGDETWSPLDILGHLVHGERTDWMPRVRAILEHGETRPFEPFDRFAQLAPPERSCASLLDDFAALRRASLDELASLGLTAADLDRRGRHPQLGVVTLRQLLATWVAHDLDHVAQIARVLARQYTDEVGPWRAYLRIISGLPG
mgnify:CR=1 FL=1